MVPGPFDLDAMFRINKNPQVSRSGEIISIENFYENPNAIYQWIMQHQKPFWKKYDNNTRNAIDYNDCRIAYNHSGRNHIYLSTRDFLLKTLKNNYWPGDYVVDYVYEFNVFQTVSIFDNAFQHFPHVDSSLTLPDDKSVINVLVYLDKQYDGGTAIYEGPYINNEENINLLVPVEEKLKIKKVIPNMFNKCVMFPGNRMHGAYVEDYENYCKDRWRITQVMFFMPVDENGRPFNDG